MSDDRKAWRPRSHQDRDVYVSKATPASGVPEFTAEEITGRYADEELRDMRSRRPTPERLRILESKHDELNKTVTEIHLGVREMGGQMGVLLKHILPGQTEKQKTERVRISGRTKVIVAIVGAVSAIAALVAGVV